MRIDPMLLKQVARNASMLASTRVASNDKIEAKANIIVRDILKESLNPGNSPVALRTPSVEEAAEEQATPTPASTPREDEGSESPSSQSFILPPAHESGLVTPGLNLDESQVSAIDMLLTKQYGCLIGAAGSGKTTSQRFFLHRFIYEGAGFKVKKLEGKQGLNIALCAYTGIATQVIKNNMPEWLHPSCKTIHSLLEFMPVMTEIVNEKGELRESQVFMPARTKANKLDHEVIIIDEASMVGLDLWHQLLDACRPGTKIFLVGDLNQLPPVASQSVFAYALAEWPVAELTKIHRQKEAAANRIIDVAHSILTGQTFEFDDPTTNHNWRVIGYELPSDPSLAGQQIVAIANAIRNKRIHESVDPERPPIYDPYLDRVITAGNGYDDSDPRAGVQQAPINYALSRLIQPPSEDNPIIMIDAGRSQKRFAVNHRVMATKNEPPDVVDRVTNGMTGRIIGIERNSRWEGNPLTVGPEDEVKAARKEALDSLMNARSGKSQALNDFDANGGLTALASFDSSSIRINTNQKDQEGGGFASHTVTVEFLNGAIRRFSSKAQVDTLELAYASTCHKCQGSQFDTAIIVVHHCVKGQLSREWLYTAVTRAAKRVIMLYTKHGIRVAVAKQKIHGSTLAEKIRIYKRITEESADRNAMLFKGKRTVRLYVENGFKEIEDESDVGFDEEVDA